MAVLDRFHCIMSSCTCSDLTGAFRSSTNAFTAIQPSLPRGVGVSRCGTVLPLVLGIASPPSWDLFNKRREGLTPVLGVIPHNRGGDMVE